MAITKASKAAELEDADWRRVLGPSLLFVASFSAIFIALGLTATGLGSTLQDHKDLLTKISGVLIIAMGVLFVGSLFITRLNRDRGLTIVFIEQNVELALGLAHRGYVLESGRNILDGPSAALLQSAEVKRIFLGA